MLKIETPQSERKQQLLGSENKQISDTAKEIRRLAINFESTNDMFDLYEIYKKSFKVLKTNKFPLSEYNKFIKRS